MNILVPTRFVPWPLIEGGRAAQYRSYEACLGACQFNLLVPVYTAAEEENAKVCNQRLPNVHVKTVRCYRPAVPPTIPRRLINLLKKILRVAPPRPGSQRDPELLPDYPFHQIPPVYLNELERELSKDYDLVQVEYVDLLTLGTLLAGRIPAVFLHLQLHFVYARRFIQACRREDAATRYLVSRIETEEKAYLPYFEHILVYSEIDKAALLEFCPGLNVHVSPFPCPEEPGALIRESRSDARFVFVASESHKPNFDGLCWFMDKVWPQIKKALPDARIEVIGRWSDAARQKVPQHEQIFFSGFVESLIPALQGKIMVVPLWIGSGIRTKILAAWGAGCPVVTTTIGAEGLPGQPVEHFLLADDSAAFASACVQLAGDQETRRRIAINGHKIVQQYFSLAAVKQRRLQIYGEVVSAWKTKRMAEQ